MANLNAVLNDRISRVARKQIRIETGVARRLVTQHRRDIAALKRQVADLTRRLGSIETHAQKTMGVAPVKGPLENVRFSARSVRAQRKRLGLSGEKFARLLGVSPLSVYHWESGNFRPRKEQFAKLVAIRTLGRREAAERLEKLGKKK